MNELIQTAAIGAVAGLRAFTPPAAVSRAAATGLLELAEPPLSLLSSRRASKILLGFALVELITDKLPVTPSRLETGSLLARFLSGALCGAAMNASLKRPALEGAMVGAAAAMGAAFAGYHARKAIVEGSELPDTAVALMEDAIALGAAFTVTALLKPATGGPDLRHSR